MERIKQIKKLSRSAMAEAKEYIDSLAKPLGSLGKLEEYAVRLAGIRGYMGCPFRKSGILVFASDNGIHEEGISPLPQSVTATEAMNIANGKAGVSVFAKQTGSEIFVYNVGIKDNITDKNIIDVNIKHGTENIVKGPAMSRDDCLKAFKIGFQAALDHSDCDVLGIGEIGICNTSISSAILSVLAEIPVREATGYGAGCTEEQYQKKLECIKKAIETNRPVKKDVFDVLSKIGGFDIAAMTGAFIGAAYTSTPAVIDGFISAVAALCAYRLNEFAIDYMFASHRSAEPGYSAVIKQLQLEPAISLDMSQGEGSGCPLMFNILNASLMMVENMSKLTTARINNHR